MNSKSFEMAQESPIVPKMAGQTEIKMVSMPEVFDFEWRSLEYKICVNGKAIQANPDAFGLYNHFAKKFEPTLTQRALWEIYEYNYDSIEAIYKYQITGFETFVLSCLLRAGYVTKEFAKDYMEKKNSKQ